MSLFFRKEELMLEAFENFQKQSYRNRCQILTPNGVNSLITPVIGGKDQKTIIRDIRIDYSSDWQKQQLKSLEAAYNSSPFFEYIIDDFRFVFNQKEEFLFDLNYKIIEVLAEYLQFDLNLELSDDFVLDVENDYRNSIHPKAKMQKEDHNYKISEYYQTFIDRFGFTPNLSIIDLLFNEGPRTGSILRQSLLKE